MHRVRHTLPTHPSLHAGRRPCSIPPGSTRLPSSRPSAALLALLLLALGIAQAQRPAAPWRSATEKELQALLPARAAVENEHIETELRTASGITDGNGRFIAGVVLITAGYAADGKYSHFLITQAPMQLGAISIPPGEYVLGWQRGENGLNVHLYQAATGAPKGTAVATLIEGVSRVESFKIWPPDVRSGIQIGRFLLPYRLLP